MIANLCQKYDLQEHCNEKAFDLITYDIKNRMQHILDISTDAELAFNNQELEIEEKLTNISNLLFELDVIYHQYDTDIEKIDRKNIIDFGPYLALKALRDQFIWKVAEQLMHYDTLLKKQI